MVPTAGFPSLHEIHRGVIKPQRRKIGDWYAKGWSWYGITAPPVVSSSARSWCSSRDAAGDGADHCEELELDPAIERSGFNVLDALNHEFTPDIFSLLYVLLAKTSSKTLTLLPK